LSRNGKLSADYDGERTAEAIASWCRKRSGPAAAPIQDKGAYDQWVAKSSGTKIVAFAEQDSDAHKTVLAVAEDAAVDEFAFAVVFNKDAASQIVSDAAFPGFAILKGEETTKYDGEFNTEDILAWVLKNGYPLIEELSQNVFKRASTSQRPLFVGFTNSETGDVAEQTQFFTDVATDLAGKALFSFVAHNKFPNLASQWGASGNKYPTAVFVTWSGATPKIRAFDEADEFTVESVKSWAEQCLSGTCKAFRKSEPIPESNDEPVTVVVGKNFEDVVLDTTKDVLVEFYAPWCGHCKKLAPIYDQLGERFAKVESVVIAKSDATANGYPDTINVRGFPTLIFFKADDKANPITYEGDRDLASLEKFILEKASVKVDASQLASTSEEDHDEL
jgi:protein disulfide-isomerase A1